ncbi:MAG TPA: hypothetical protein PLB89_12555 [Flavobacteriales bacterium]|nr:hypothetical protein [Flavobacteriales bacterium]
MTSTYEDLYADLGFLFYSVAASDGKVSHAEMEKLKQLVKDQWLPMEPSRDDLGTDAAHYIDISFDYALDEGMDADVAFDRFADYFRQNKAQFDPSLRRMIYETAAAIAGSFAGNNKAELVRLGQLEQLFGE